MAQIRRVWRPQQKKLMVVILLTAAKLGYPTHLLRMSNPSHTSSLAKSKPFQGCVHHLGPLQVGPKSAWLHSREGLFDRLPTRCHRVTIAHTQGMKGLEAPAIKNKIALRVSLTGSIFMDAVKVSHDQILPKSLGIGSAFSCLNSARYGGLQAQIAHLMVLTF